MLRGSRDVKGLNIPRPGMLTAGQHADDSEENQQKNDVPLFEIKTNVPGNVRI